MTCLQWNTNPASTVVELDETCGDASPRTVSVIRGAFGLLGQHNVISLTIGLVSGCVIPNVSDRHNSQFFANVFQFCFQNLSDAPFTNRTVALLYRGLRVLVCFAGTVERLNREGTSESSALLPWILQKSMDFQNALGVQYKST